MERIRIDEFYNSAYILAEILKREINLDDKMIICAPKEEGLIEELKSHNFTNLIQI